MIDQIVERQKTFFNSGQTLDLSFRKQKLKLLKKLIIDHEEPFIEALHQDFRKPRMESYATELMVLQQEIDHLLAHIDEWARPKKEKKALINFPARNYVQPQPYGTSLIIGPWNYPVQLTLNPALGAIAAGNTVIIKPSEIAPHSSSVLAELINNHFDSNFLYVQKGDAETTQQLLSQPIDYIFFTGSTHVGKIIMKAAAEQLTPLTLELGGKSPTIVDQTADIELAAKRIAWGKFINAGQTCVSPDYVYIQESKQEEFYRQLKQCIHSFYGDDPVKSDDFARIINEKHFNRLQKLIQPDKVYSGGQTIADRRYIAPTLMTDVSWDDPIMQEEIFGPILPILTFKDIDDVIELLQDKPTPLALYLFSTDENHHEKVMHKLRFGGGCINDTVAHLGNPALPFGGMGSSGFGTYHGKASFDTFSHPKSIMKKANWLDIPFRYPPYDGKLTWLKKLTKYL